MGELKVAQIFLLIFIIIISAIVTNTAEGFLIMFSIICGVMFIAKIGLWLKDKRKED